MADKALKPTTFEFVSATFSSRTRVARFSFRQNFKNARSLSFVETLHFPSAKQQKLSPILQKALLRDLHLVLGISYYKAYLAPKFFTPYELTAAQKDFWDQLYLHGLGELLYRNKIDPARVAKFSYSARATSATTRVAVKDRSLVGIGGGKDSIVGAKLLQEYGQPIAGFFVATERPSAVVQEVIQTLNVPSVFVSRKLDPKIFETLPGSINGHVPISAITAFIGTMTALLYDYRYVVVSNEYSSNFGNVRFRGLEVNHQWSKSEDFERRFQEYVRNNITPSVVYYSQIRPWYEIRVVELFSKYPEFFPLFTSCNRNFRAFRERSESLWCGECAKCAFSYLLFAAFFAPNRLKYIFGKNFFDEPRLFETYRDLLGLGVIKPFDCVGPFDESQTALVLAAEKFPEYKNSVVVKAFLSKVRGIKKHRKTYFTAYDAPTIPARFRFLGMRNVLIAGFGAEGKVTQAYLQKFYPKLPVTVVDRKSGASYLKNQKNFDIAVKTPAIRLSDISIPHTSATEIFLSHIQNTVVGVTGSKGKSTTASLVFTLLREKKIPVRLVGNIGTPMLSLLLKNPPKRSDVLVIELSSYQLEDLHVSPQIALVTNLFPDHMDHHGGLQVYYDAKKNITKFQSPADVLIFGAQNAEFSSWGKETFAQKFFAQGALPVDLKKTHLVGEHNAANIRLAYACARLLGVTKLQAQRALEKFQPLPHRMQKVGTFSGVTFFDDAISTTPESTIAALSSLPHVATIFLGGQDRGYSFVALEKYIRQSKIKNIVLFPDSGNNMFLHPQKNEKIFRTKSMKDAVAFAYRVTPKGSAVLLSCASPSYSLWKNFEEKGLEFQKFVQKLSHKK